MIAEAQDGVGAPDALQRLWTPHRMAYIKRGSESGPEAGAAECPFCRISTMADADGLIREIKGSPLLWVVGEEPPPAAQGKVEE